MKPLNQLNCQLLGAGSAFLVIEVVCNLIHTVRNAAHIVIRTNQPEASGTKRRAVCYTHVKGGEDAH